MALLSIGNKKSKQSKTEAKNEILANLPKANPAGFVVSDDAAKKITEELGKLDRKDGFLRVAITGGGCAGLSYDFSFVEEKREKEESVPTAGRWDDEEIQGKGKKAQG